MDSLRKKNYNVRCKPSASASSTSTHVTSTLSIESLHGLSLSIHKGKGNKNLDKFIRAALHQNRHI